MDNTHHQGTISLNKIFGDGFLDTNQLYLHYFNAFPSLHYINNINSQAAAIKFREKYAGLIQQEFEDAWYNRSKKRYEQSTIIFILSNQCVIEFKNNYCEVAHSNTNYIAFLTEITSYIDQFKERQRKEPLEINLIVSGAGNMVLKSMEIKRTKLNLDLFYEADFKPVDELIRARLNKNNDKGIIMLHGLPGTGKTTYLRYLIGKMKKKVLFLSPSVAGNLMNPEFIDLLIDNPNSVLIIEDAENIIMDRRNSSDSSVSNLLNISDGLMADFLNVQIICTFNSSLTLIDSALLRKGRLIAKYEFGKLSITKAQQLSNYLGFSNTISKPMTLAEISHQHENNFQTKQVNTIGFRREPELAAEGNLLN